MSIYGTQKSKSYVGLIAGGILLSIVTFSIGRWIAPPAIAENSRDYILAQAEARGKEQARFKEETIRAEAAKFAQKRFQEQQLKQQQEQQQKALAVAQQQKEKDAVKAEAENHLKELNLTRMDSYTNWTDIGQGWQVRGVKLRLDLKTDDAGKQYYDTTNALFEYSLRRTDGKHPRLTRILFEVFDENKEFMFPGVVDISGADASLTYVRTSSYDLKGKKPTYVRVDIGDVGVVKYVNDYPSRR